MQPIITSLKRVEHSRRTQKRASPLNWRKSLFTISSGRQTHTWCQRPLPRLFCTADEGDEQRQFTRKGKFQPKVKRWPEENVNKGGCPLCHPSCTADEKQAAKSQKWKEHNQRQKGTWRQYGGSKHRLAYDGSYSLCTADESQATADSWERKELNERQKMLRWEHK